MTTSGKSNMMDLQIYSRKTYTRLMWDSKSFSDNDWIWDNRIRLWVELGQCIWDGPEFISTKTVLTRTYGGNNLLNSFFTTILGIRTLRTNDIIEEIENRRDRQSSAQNLSNMRDIYKFLAEHASSDEDWRLIKWVFTFCCLELVSQSHRCTNYHIPTVMVCEFRPPDHI